MAKTRSFGGRNESTWECIKSTSQSQHGTSYEPAGATEGKSVTSTAIGAVVLSFNFDQAKETVTYTIQEKPSVGSGWN